MTQIGASRLYRVGAMSSSVYYDDPQVALAWLQAAFGFEIALIVQDADGVIGHIEMAYGDGVITVASRWADFAKTPGDLAGANTQSIKVVLEEDLDAHFARAVSAGAVVIQAPEDQAYLQRTYRCADPDGHVWTFAANLPDAPRGDA